MKAILPKSKDGKDAPESVQKTKEDDSVRAKAMLSTTQQGPSSSSQPPRIHNTSDS